MHDTVSDIDTHKITITIFMDQYAKKKGVRQWTLAEMRDKILQTTAATKKKLPWLKMADFGNKTTDKGSLRHDANVLAVTGIELDYDAEMISFEEGIDQFKQLNIRGMGYTTPTNTSTKMRWRLMVPFSRRLPPPERRVFFKRLHAAMGGIFAPESATLSQSYYFGRALDNGAADHRATVVGGRFLDLCDELTSFDEPTPSPSPPLLDTITITITTPRHHHLSRRRQARRRKPGSSITCRELATAINPSTTVSMIPSFARQGRMRGSTALISIVTHSRPNCRKS